MSAMDPQRDTTGTNEGAVESIKIEKNTKGYNWSYRVIKKPHQDWKDVLRECRELEEDLKKQYGG